MTNDNGKEITLRFPFRNLAFNNLHHFFERDYYIKYSSIQPTNTWESTLFEDENDIFFYLERIPNFENEILQVINTCNQETIDYYLDMLDDDIRYLNSLSTPKSLLTQVNEWNEEAWKKYPEIVEKNSEKYFNQEERKKYAHLEKYESTEYDGLFSIFSKNPPKKTTKINYNFYCVEEEPYLVDPLNIKNYSSFLNFLIQKYSSFANNYIDLWKAGKIKAKMDVQVLKPILFVEGELDIKYLLRAAELLGRKDIFDKIDIRQRGSCNNLDRLWKVLTENNWETYPQIKILLYDCDTGRSNEDSGHLYRRIIPIKDHNPIKKGIENLLSSDCISSAQNYKPDFIDHEYIHRVVRGKEFDLKIVAINKDEKTNFCNWVCANAKPEYFSDFNSIFNIIDSIVN